MIGAAAPAGALPRRLQFPVFPETELAPPCRTEALTRGALPIPVFTIFSSLGCEPDRFMIDSPGQFFLVKKTGISFFPDPVKRPPGIAWLP